MVDNSINDTGAPPEIFGKILFVWEGMGKTTELWVVDDKKVGRGFGTNIPMKTAQLFLYKQVKLTLNPNRSVAAISAMEE